MVIELKEQYFTTLSTDETCPYCEHKDVVMDFGQLYATAIYVVTAQSRKTGRAHCTHCGNEIPQKQWSPRLKTFFNTNKRKYRMAARKRYSLLIFFLLMIGGLFSGGVILIGGIIIWIIITYFANKRERRENRDKIISP